MLKKIWLLTLCTCIPLVFTACGKQEQPLQSQPADTSQSQQTSTKPPQPTLKKYAAAPKMSIDQNKEYIVTLKTNYGDIVIQLFPKDAPLAVNNFVFLARDGYYNYVRFHRIMKNFMIQSGDPTGTGRGSPGYTFADEKITREYIPGTLAMANAGADTNGSQFFICLVDLSTGLSKDYTIFGLVTSGMDVVSKIGDAPVKASRSGELSSPMVDIYISSIQITEK
jgi:cyclophilin family peptidyl-prolyl cis-trans isomerase